MSRIARFCGIEIGCCTPFASGTLDGGCRIGGCYAAFHAISALHLAHGNAFSSHSQLIGQFNKRFVKSGIFPSEFSRLLTRLFEDRQTGDYDAAISVSRERARQDIADAERILAEVRNYLSSRDSRRSEDH